MSMTEMQVKKLKELAERFIKEGRCIDDIHTLYDAIDTINTLSAKLSSANFEKSSMHYHDGWIPVDERLPEQDELVLVDDGSSLKLMSITTRVCGNVMWNYRCKTYYPVDQIEAWAPLPIPYHSKTKEKF